MTDHAFNAAEYRARAADAADRGQASPLDNVHEANARAAARWSALADLEDMFVAKASERAGLSEVRESAREAIVRAWAATT